MSFTYPVISDRPPLGSIPLTANPADGTLVGLPKRPRLAGQDFLMETIERAFATPDSWKDYVGDDGLLETAPNSQSHISNNTPCTEFIHKDSGRNLTRDLTRGVPVFIMAKLSKPMEQRTRRLNDFTNSVFGDKHMADEYVVVAPYTLNDMLLRRAKDSKIEPLEKLPSWVRKNFDFHGWCVNDSKEAQFMNNIQIMVVDLQHVTSVRNVTTPKVWNGDHIRFVVRMVPWHQAVAICVDPTARVDKLYDPCDDTGRPVRYVTLIFAIVTQTYAFTKYNQTLNQDVKFPNMTIGVPGYWWNVCKVDRTVEQGVSQTRKNNDEVYENFDMPFGGAMRSIQHMMKNPDIEAYIS